jgi:hypothetical protein
MWRRLHHALHGREILRRVHHADVMAAVGFVDEAGEKNEFDHVDTFVGSAGIQASSLFRFLLEPALRPDSNANGTRDDEDKIAGTASA